MAIAVAAQLADAAKDRRKTAWHKVRQREKQKYASPFSKPAPGGVRPLGNRILNGGSPPPLRHPPAEGKAFSLTPSPAGRRRRNGRPDPKRRTLG